jgi:hypothetical protein
MTVNVSPEDRANLLAYAASLLSREDRANPVLVAAAARSLLEWAEQAADDNDLRARMRAMGLHYVNAGQYAGSISPDQFVDQAGTLYAFIAAGRKD